MKQLLHRLRAILGEINYIEIHSCDDLPVMYISYRKIYMGESTEREHFIKYYFLDDRMEVGYYDDSSIFNEYSAQFKISQVVAIKEAFQELFPEGVAEGHYIIS